MIQMIADIILIPTELTSISIDWGDGQTTEKTPDSSTSSGMGDRHEVEETHTYAASPSGQESYNIVIDHEFEHGVHYYHNAVWKENHGFEYYDDDGNAYYDTSFRSNEEWSYCRLQEPDTSALPSPPIINEFITNGPFEVMTQQIDSSDADGKTSRPLLRLMPAHMFQLFSQK